MVIENNEVDVSDQYNYKRTNMIFGTSKFFAVRWLPVVAKYTILAAIPIIIFSAILASNDNDFHTESAPTVIIPASGNTVNEADFPPSNPLDSIFIQTYYITVEEVGWNYMPNGIVKIL